MTRPGRTPAHGTAPRKKKRTTGFRGDIIEILAHQVLIAVYVIAVLLIHAAVQFVAHWIGLEHAAWVISLEIWIGWFARTSFCVFEAIELVGGARRRWLRAVGKEDE